MGINMLERNKLETKRLIYFPSVTNLGRDGGLNASTLDQIVLIVAKKDNKYTSILVT